MCCQVDVESALAENGKDELAEILLEKSDKEPRREDGLVAMVTNRWESTILVILSCTTATVRPVSLQISRGHWIHPRGNVYKVSSGCTISSADFSIHIFIYFSSYLTLQHLQCAVHRECHSDHNLKRECREKLPLADETAGSLHQTNQFQHCSKSSSFCLGLSCH